MTKKILSTIFLSLSFALVSFAQDVNGKWTGKVMGQYDVVYFFEYDGETLNGKSISPQGTEIPIKDGSIKGKNMQFKMELMGNTSTFFGKIDKDKIYLRMPIRDTEIAVILVKVEK